MRHEFGIDPADVTVREPLPEEAGRLAMLFDAYRVFYERAPDAHVAARFVERQLDKRVTRFFVACVGGDIVGFVHLLPTMDTLAMRPAWLLEDLYVDRDVRGRGIGSALMRYAENFARETGARRISLTTAHTNVVAQHLYESRGYGHDTTFRTYHRELE